MKIITNNHERELQYAVPEWSNEEQECFTFKGETYFIDEFSFIGEQSPFSEEWDGYLSDSFFSGILIHFSEDYERIVVGWYYG